MNTKNAHGVVSYTAPSTRRTDYLYRVSIKCLVRNTKGEVLVVKESGRDWWDLPGGGMDHHESIKGAIAREMHEEVMLQGDFKYNVIAVDEPAYLEVHNFWQLRLIFEIKPERMDFGAGDDGDEIAFMDPLTFKDAHSEVEQRIYRYSKQTA